MSEENVEIVRTAMEAFNRRDAKTFAAYLAEDAEIVPMRAALEGTVYRGPDAASQYCAAVEESWDNLWSRSRRSETASTGFSPWDGFAVAELTAAPRLTLGPGGSFASETD
ncbi:MAG: hypothetical protein WB462_13450 [Solirubrobacterales bacterium]